MLYYKRLAGEIFIFDGEIQIWPASSENNFIEQYTHI